MPLIIAPSASGKSFFVRQRGQPFVDGDVIIRDTIGWPTQRHWWKDKAVADRFRPLKIAALTGYLTSFPDHYVLFATGVRRAARAGLKIDAVVVPSDFEIRRNVASRAAEPDHGQPTDLGTLLLWAHATRAEAFELHIPTFGSFEAAHSWLEARRGGGA